MIDARGWAIIILIGVGIFFFETAFADDSNSSLCQEYLMAEKELNTTLPRKIDETTEMTQFLVNCDTTTVKYTKRILVDLSLFNEGWQIRKQINSHRECWALCSRRGSGKSNNKYY